MIRFNHFVNNNLELAQLNLSQVHGTPPGYKQFFSEVGTSKFLHKKGKDL